MACRTCSGARQEAHKLFWQRLKIAMNKAEKQEADEEQPDPVLTEEVRTELKEIAKGAGLV